MLEKRKKKEKKEKEEHEKNERKGRKGKGKEKKEEKEKKERNIWQWSNSGRKVVRVCWRCVLRTYFWGCFPACIAP